MSLKEFVKIAVGLREHPKVLHAGDEGGWLYVCAIMWSKEHDTDGFIPEHAVSRLTGLKQPVKVMQRCVAAGLMEVADGGWMIHDYLEVQESSERRKAAGRKAAKVRWDRERASQTASDSHANRTANAVRDRNTEEEEEKEEETPPRPPSGGRGRDLESFSEEMTQWAMRTLPDKPSTAVVWAVNSMRGRNVPDTDITPDRIRSLIDGAHPAMAKAWAA